MVLKLPWHGLFLLLHLPIPLHSSWSFPTRVVLFGVGGVTNGGGWTGGKLDVQAERIHDRRKTWYFSLSLVPPQRDRELTRD